MPIDHAQIAAQLRANIAAFIDYVVGKEKVSFAFDSTMLEESGILIIRRAGDVLPTKNPNPSDEELLVPVALDIIMEFCPCDSTSSIRDIHGDIVSTELHVYKNEEQEVIDALNPSNFAEIISHYAKDADIIAENVHKAGFKRLVEKHKLKEDVATVRLSSIGEEIADIVTQHGGLPAAFGEFLTGLTAELLNTEGVTAENLKEAFESAIASLPRQTIAREIPKAEAEVEGVEPLAKS